MVKNSFSSLVNLKKLMNNRKRLLQSLSVLWMRIFFLLVPMRFLLRLENSISDIIILVMVGAILLMTLATIYRVAGNPFSDSSPKIKKNDKNLPSEESTDSKESQKVIYIIIFVERMEDDYTELLEEEYPSDFEDDLLMDPVHYPFRNVDLNIRSINGFDTRRPIKNWSLGKVYCIIYENEDIHREGEIVWVWVQIHLYYPMPMPTSFFIRCELSKDFESPHPISKGNFVLLEYDAKRDEENFLNRTFTIIKIEERKE